MENGYLSLRNIEKACKTDIRYMWLLDGMKVPSHVTFGNFIKNELVASVEDIFRTINRVIFDSEHVDTDHAYIDGTKIEANANKYTWVSNPLQRDLQQRIQASGQAPGSMRQAQNVMDQQKQLYQNQRAIQETPSSM